MGMWVLWWMTRVVLFVSGWCIWWSYPERQVQAEYQQDAECP